MIERVARGLVIALLERIESGQLTLVEGDRRRVFGSGSPQATVVVRDPALWPALRRGGKGLALAYVHGLWDSPDLTAVIEVAARNLHGAGSPRSASPGSAPARCGRATRRRARATTSPRTTTSGTSCSR
jgi:cyclopropane-fatty-acyl-phospholipid synthase